MFQDVVDVVGVARGATETAVCDGVGQLSDPLGPRGTCNIANLTCLHIVASRQARRLRPSEWFGDTVLYTQNTQIYQSIQENERGEETAQKRLDKMTDNAPACSQPFI
jgi:hypothetical protein